MKELLFIPGLGADERIFEPYRDKLRFKVLDCSKIEMGWNVFIESLLDQIKSQNPVIVGVSFGSLLAQALKEKLPKATIILVSGFRSPQDLPKILRFVPQQLAPCLAILGKNYAPAFIWKYFFGIRSKSEFKLLQSILEDTSNEYLKWSVGIILNWKLKEVEIDFSIHGINDRIVPYLNSHDLQLEGGHFLIYQRHQEIGNQIFELLHSE